MVLFKVTFRAFKIWRRWLYFYVASQRAHPDIFRRAYKEVILSYCSTPHICDLFFFPISPDTIKSATIVDLISFLASSTVTCSQILRPSYNMWTSLAYAAALLAVGSQAAPLEQRTTSIPFPCIVSERNTNPFQ